MKPMSNTKYTFTDNEFWFLLTLFAPSLVIGFCDPTKGMLREEILELRQKVSDKLSERKIIQREKNKIYITDPLHSYCWQMTHAERVLLISLKNKNGPTTTLAIYPSSDQFVVSTTRKGSADIEVFFASEGEIFKRIFGMKGAGREEPLVESVGLNIEQEKITQAHRLIRDGDIESAARLANNSDQTELWQSYLNTIKEPEITCAIIAFTNCQSSTDMHTKGFSFLTDKENCWIVEPNNEDQRIASIRNSTKQAVQQRIRIFLQYEVIV